MVLKTHVAEAPSEGQLTRLRHEFELLLDLDGQTLPKAYALVDQKPGLALVMEDVGGEPVARWSRGRAGSPRPLLDVLRVARGALAGLAALHRRGIVHRDVVPQNILYDPERGQGHLVDLSHASRLRRGKPLPANPHALDTSVVYISPEQTGRTSRLIDYRTDFYSLGVTLYELLTGAPPFPPGDPLETIHAHLTKRPLHPRAIRREIPPFLSDLVMRLLEKNAEDRYQSADGIAADVEACVAHLERGGEDAPLPASIGARDFPLWFEIPSKLYGRERELAAIRESVERAASGDACVVFMAGPPGLGKSSIVAEVGGLLAQHHGQFAYGKFQQLADHTPYAAVIQAVRALVRQMLTEPDEALQDWKLRLGAALGRNAPLILDVAPELEALLGPQAPLGDVGPLEARARLNFAFRSFLQAIARRGRPLALFLDDLQWADAPSLQLVESLFLDGDMRYFVLLGAYRDNEVDASHPAALTLSRLREGARCAEVRLSPLGAPSAAAMLSESLGLEPAAVADLAELCAERCAGNPMLMREFITALVDQGLVRLGAPAGSLGARRWTWDIAAIRGSRLTDDAAKLISQRASALPAPTQRLLQHAACMGNVFLLSRVARALDTDLRSAARALRPALAAEIVYVSPEDEAELSLLATDDPSAPAGAEGADVRLSFRHDLLLHAAYATIPEGERPRLHLKVGEALRSFAREDDAEGDVFAVLNQLNRARALLTEPGARVDLARLNLAGGKRAAASAAQEAALGYFEIALGLLDDGAWDEHHALMAELHLRAAEAACVTSAFARCEALVAAALSHAREPLERGRLLEVRMIRVTLEGRYAEALATGSEALACVGEEALPPPDRIGSVVRDKLAWIQEQLRARPIASLLDLPSAEAPEAKLAAELISTMSAPAYFTGPDYVGWAAARIVESCLRHGNTPASSMGYAVLGSIFSNVLGLYAEGAELGRLALAMADHYNDGVARGRARCIFANNYGCWTKPLRWAFGVNEEALRATIESGDLAYVGYVQLLQSFSLFSAGVALSRIEETLPECIRAGRRTNNHLALDHLEALGAILSNLQGRTRGPFDFDLPGRPERVFLEDWAANGSRMAIAKYHVAKAQTLYIHGDDEDAYRCVLEAESLQGFTLGQYSNTEALWYGSLCLLRKEARSSGEGRAATLALVRERQQPMKAWSDLCPENYAHGYLLVEAEIDRLAGNPWEAARKYKEAIRLATASEFQQCAALAHELCGRSWLEAGEPRYGALHLEEARAGYAAWGALRKVEFLEQEFGFLAGARADAAPPAGESFDVTSLLKATAALSSSLLEAELHERLLRIAAENAGATRGVLALCRGEQWSVEAEIDTSRDQVRATPRAGDAPRVPPSVLHYVRRTRAPLVLDDALEAEGFRADPSYAGGRPVSVLCVPILRQSAVTAILYLENDLVSKAFRPAQVETLRVLAAQAAISIENARLYADREDEVRSRTHELEAANEQILAMRLAEQQAQERQMQEKLALIERQEELIRMLSVPIIQVWDDVLALPIVGMLDDRRAGEVLTALLDRIVQTRSRYAIVDLTGVHALDLETADRLGRIVRTVRLLGAQCMLSGIRPAVAQTMTSLGVELGSVASYASLREALRGCAGPAGAAPRTG